MHTFSKKNDNNKSEMITLLKRNQASKTLAYKFKCNSINLMYRPSITFDHSFVTRLVKRHKKGKKGALRFYIYRSPE